MFFSLFTHSGLQHAITIWVTCMYLIRNRNCLLLREHGFLYFPDWLVGSVLPIFFCVVACALLFVFVMCSVPNFVLCLVHLTLPVFLDCPFLIDPSVFSNVYLYVSLDCTLMIVTSVFLAINQQGYNIIVWISSDCIGRYINPATIQLQPRHGFHFILKSYST